MKENKDFDEFMNNDNRTIYKRYVRKTILRNDYVVFDYLRNGKYLTRLGYLTGNVMYINPPYNKNITRYKTLEDWANYKGIKVVHKTPIKTRTKEKENE